MDMTHPALHIKIRIYCGDEIAMGPGKADLLEAIIEHGSISAAGRALGMSYRRTWMLVDVMNRCWDEPLVITAAGGSRGGGARISKLGMQVLSHYRNLEQKARSAAEAEEWSALSSFLRDQPKEAHRKTTD